MKSGDIVFHKPREHYSVRVDRETYVDFKPRPLDGVRVDDEDGVYYAENTNVAGWFQLIVIGPMNLQPSELAYEYGAFFGGKYRVTQVGVLACEPDASDEVKRALLDRGFINIIMEKVDDGSGQ